LGKLQNFKREINLTKNGAKFMPKKKNLKKVHCNRYKVNFCSDVDWKWCRWKSSPQRDKTWQ